MKRSLQNAPEGRLRGIRHSHQWQYYCRRPGGPSNGIYIRKEDYPFASKLGQKEYNKRILTAAQAELELLNELSFLEHKSSGTIEHVYENLPEWNQVLVRQIEEPLDEYIARWRSAKYTGKSFDGVTTQYYTRSGIRTRSKSEAWIGDKLDDYHIPYHYEKPLYLKGYGTVYPDFTTLDCVKRREVYWEHLGMVGDGDYCDTSFAKIADYERNGYFLGDQLILSYESSLRPLDMKLIEKKIRYIYHIG